MSKVLNKLAHLAEIIKNSNNNAEEIKDDLDFLVKRIETFPKYFNSILIMETRLELGRFRLEPDDLAEMRTKLDHNRRDCHIIATNSINQLNRLAKAYNQNSIFIFPVENNVLNPENIEHREMAADCIFDFCKEVFLDVKEKEFFKEMEEYNIQKNEELYEFHKTGKQFKSFTNVEDLITQAEHDITTSRTENTHKIKDDDLCL